LDQNDERTSYARKNCYIGNWIAGPDRSLNKKLGKPSKLQGSKAFCASCYPQVTGILEGLQRSLNARCRSIKHARVTVFPEDPCPKYDQRIETFLSMFLYFLQGLPPPSCKGDCSPGWYQTREVQRLHDVEPELPGEDTRSENMLNVFVFLVAERGNEQDVAGLFFQTICCPTAISNRKPDKNLAFVRCPWLPLVLCLKNGKSYLLG